MTAPYIEIQERRVGLDEEPLVIAEIGINHNGSLDTAKEMVDAAADSGIEIIKHQTHIVEDEMSKEAKNIIPGNSTDSIFKIMDDCSLDEEEEYELMKYVEAKGMIFFSTPFSRAALRRLESFEVPAFKIGSGECNNYPLLDLVARNKKPTILSTGMNSIKSIDKAVDIFKNYKTPFALMHTTNLYPTPHKLVRLNAVSQLLERYQVPVGLSDHTVDNNACLGAVALGASILERHFTDSMEREGPDIVCSMDSLAAKELIKSSKLVYQCRGGEKGPLPEEQVTIDFAFASVCSTKGIKKGEIFSEENIWVKRPGKGDFSADDYFSLIGKKALKEINSDTQIKKEHVES